LTPPQSSGSDIRDVGEVDPPSNLLAGNKTVADPIFRALLESAPDSIVIVDADGRIALVNRQVEQMFGYQRDELIGQPIEILVPERFHHFHVGYRQGYTASPRTRPMGAALELYARRKDRTEFPVEISLSPLDAPDGLLVTSIIRDITARKSAEAQFRGLLESAPDAIVIIDEQARISQVNKQVESMFGYERGELIDQPIEMLIPERFRGHHVAHRDAYIASPRTRPMGAGLELFGRRRDGTEFPVEISLSPLETPGGTLITSIIRDVSDRKRVEADLKQAAAELESSNAELEQFAYVASHDLQEPLRMVASYTQMLARRYQGKLDEDADEFIAYAVDGATRMQALINDLLAYSRVGTRGREFEPTDTAAIVDQVMADLNLAAEEAGAQVTRGPLPIVRGDTVQLGQLFQNLIANAIKFRGERPPVVDVTARREGTMWRFAVRDNGIGIDPEYSERIFVIFQRLHARAEYPGTGIGLAICKKIVERHGGRVWLESRPGEGTTFWFTIPAGGV
jgi:PAS domain S-box-containing protein